MKYRVITQPPAENEIEEAVRWIAKESPARAVKWYMGLVNAIGSLSTFPERCPLAPEDDAFEEEIRQLLFGKRHGVYRVLFTIRGQTVYVLHVRHSAREPLGP